MDSQVTLVLGTGNAGKVAEFRRLLASGPWRLVDLSEYRNLPRFPEGGSSIAENARTKATQIALRLRRWALADDTGLVVDALGGAPGVYSARFAGPEASPEANRRRLLEELGDTPLQRRSASFLCHLALADPAGHVRAEATGRCCGRIRLQPAGDRGFGYDSLFEIVEYRLTFAELGEAATACLGHRARAVGALWPDLVRLL